MSKNTGKLKLPTGAGRLKLTYAASSPGGHTTSTMSSASSTSLPSHAPEALMNRSRVRGSNPITSFNVFPMIFPARSSNLLLRWSEYTCGGSE